MEHFRGFGCKWDLVPASLQLLLPEIQALEVRAWKVLYCVGLSPRSPPSGGLHSRPRKLPGEAVVH